MRVLAVVALIVVVTIAMILIATSSHWWKEVNNVTITYNGIRSLSSRVYRSRNGDYLVSLNEKTENGLFIVRPNTGEVSIPNRSRFLSFHLYLYSKDMTPYTVPLKQGKMEGDPKLVIHPNYVEFTTSAGSRINIAW